MAKFVQKENNLFDVASCGGRDNFEKIHLTNLALLAENERWTTKDGDKNDILFYYIIKLFEILKKQNKVVESDKGDLLVFNTGLMTDNGEDIYGCCVKNERYGQDDWIPKWFFKGFKKESDRFFTFYKFNKPNIASFNADSNEFIFNPNANLEFNADHIFDDHWEEDNRFPDELKRLGKKVAIALINDAFKVSIAKARRNYRLAVPQYYLGKIMFLLPLYIHINDKDIITMAIAIEKNENGSYRANTIFDLDTAYKKARLLTKPESNWLLP